MSPPKGNILFHTPPVSNGAEQLGCTPECKDRVCFRILDISLPFLT